MSKVIESYKKGWQFLWNHKSVLCVIYIINLLLAYLSVGPLKNYLESAFGSSTLAKKLADKFDYTIIMDVINNYGVGVGVSLSSLFTFIFIYVFWSSFTGAGVMGLVKKRKQNPDDNFKLVQFFIEGAIYFFRFLRVSIYLLFTYAVVLFLMFKFFSKDGLSVFEFESEVFLINRFWILIILFIIIAFFGSIFRDIARSFIVIEDQPNILKSNIKALKSIVIVESIALSLINLIPLVIISALYYLLRNVLNEPFIVAFIISQIFLLFRIIYRIVRCASFLEFTD
ncbi:MAG: hypothetical protein HKN51_05740 [Saprospiraceae bacterium]|nr:hypothetical protein [Saprospiraceae bacterium]